MTKYNDNVQTSEFVIATEPKEQTDSIDMLTLVSYFTQLRQIMSAAAASVSTKGD